MTAPDPIDRLRDAIRSHDPKAVAACFTTDYRSEVPQSPDEGFVGSDRVAENWTAIFARLPDIEATVLRRATSGAAVWSEWEMVGTGPEGVPVTLCGPTIMTTRGDQIDWARFYLGPVVRRREPLARLEQVAEAEPVRHPSPPTDTTADKPGSGAGGRRAQDGRLPESATDEPTVRTDWRSRRWRPSAERRDAS